MPYIQVAIIDHRMGPVLAGAQAYPCFAGYLKFIGIGRDKCKLPALAVAEQQSISRDHYTVTNGGGFILLFPGLPVKAQISAPHVLPSARNTCKTRTYTCSGTSYRQKFLAM